MQATLASLATVLEAPHRWWHPYLPLASRLLTAEATSTADALNRLRGDTNAARFVDQSALPDGEPYESFVFRTGCVPTRDNLHDLFNGLVWLAYPQTKHRLNVLQTAEIERLGVSGARGPLRDALTLFDENAALLRAPAPLTDALRRRDWRALFLDHRAAWQSATLVLFGHALLEKLVQPRKAITAHVWLVDALDDATLAASLTTERLASKAFLPLPMLGVPGWWAANADPDFYADVEVFRPPRRPK